MVGHSGTVDESPVMPLSSKHDESKKVSKETTVNIISEPESNETMKEETTNIVSVDHDDMPSSNESAAIPTSTGETTAVSSSGQPSMIPSMRGVMVYEGGNVSCHGKWAMSDDAHNIPGQTSDFEFKLTKADEDSPIFPVNGIYDGWFKLKQGAGKPELTIEDKEMDVKFEKERIDPNSEEQHYAVRGSGHNIYGKFHLRGTLNVAGELKIYREYYMMFPRPTGAGTKRRQSIGGESKRRNSISKPAIDSSSNASEQDGSSIVSPRGEGSGRVRKQSILMKEYHDSTTKGSSPRSSSVAAVSSSSSTATAAVKEKKSVAPSSAATNRDSIERSQRKPAWWKKCSDILKEMSKTPLCVYFLEPVDPVKLNIPDYRRIIKHPMDLQTVRERMEDGVYESPDSFAEDMRLIFRNAITYNADPKNPVHLAAKDSSNRFEQRYRVMTAQLAGTPTFSAAALEEKEPPIRTPRVSLPAGNKKVAKKVAQPKSRAAGPRNIAAAAAPSVPYVAPALDPTTAAMMEMQRQMEAMRNEITYLRSAVKETEVVRAVRETQEAARNPLTVEEKKVLIAAIHKLGQAELEGVIEIIRAALPDNSDSENIEVPIDSLDTLTLRKLQQYIAQKNGGKIKSRHSFSSSSYSPGGTKLERPAKKPRKSKSNPNLSSPAMIHEEDAFFGHDDALLFTTEEMRSANPEDTQMKIEEEPSSAGVSKPSNDVMEDEDFADLVTTAPTVTATENIEVRNMNAWNA